VVAGINSRRTNRGRLARPNRPAGAAHSPPTSGRAPELVEVASSGVIWGGYRGAHVGVHL